MSNKDNKDNIEDMLLDDVKPSVPLDGKNARFERSKGGLISLYLTEEDGSESYYERVVIMRAFPVTNPNEFLSVREPDSKKAGRGREIGMIRYISDFDEQTQRLLNEELDRRYFSPTVEKIYAVKEKFGYYYWDVLTSAGHITFILNNPFKNIRMLEDGRLFISDIDGNSFEIPDPYKLDSQSRKKIDIYL